MTIAAQYFINYKSIEKPRIELEQKKAALEANKYALSVMPNVEVDCNSNVVSDKVISVNCKAKNNGAYPINIRFTEIIPRNINHRLLAPIEPSKWFNSVFTDDNNESRAYPNGQTSVDFFIVISEKNKPDGISSNHVAFSVKYEITTIPEATKLISDQFPETKNLIESLKSTKSQVIFSIH